MTRALRLLALITTLFVVSVRFLSGFPALDCLALALSGDGAIEFCPASDEPRDEDTLAPVAMDDVDDDADALIAPTPLRVRLRPSGEPPAAKCGVLAVDRALASHAPSLERPPRA